MKTTITKTVKIEQEFIVSKTCNKCGKVIEPKDKNDIWCWDKIHHIQFEFGYGSSYDAEVWDFHLCEECIEQFIETFKVPVEITNGLMW